MLRRKCTEDCVFAPYFRADQPQKFSSVHKVFGASNVSKLLNELPVDQREDAVKSLVFEADARLRDPVYGCAGVISILQHKLKHLQMDLYNAKKELAGYIGPSAMLPIIQGTENFLPRYQQEQAQAQAQMMSYNMQQSQMMPPYNLQRPQKLAPHSMQRSQMRPHNYMQLAQMRPNNAQHVQMMGGLQQTVANPNRLAVQQQQQQQYQQFMEDQQLAAALAAVKEQEMLRSYEAQQAFAAKEQELLRNNDLEELEILRDQEYYKNYMAQHIAKREQEVILRTYREKQQEALAQQQGPQSDLLVGYDITGQGQGQPATAKEQELSSNNELEEVEIPRKRENYKNYMAQQIAARENELIFRTYGEKQQAALAQQQVPQSDLLVGYDNAGEGQGQGQIPSGELRQMSVQAGMTPALVFGSLESPYQIQQHTQDDLHHPDHELQATQLLLEEQELQALALALAQPLQLNPHQALTLEQPLQLDPEQEEQQHKDESEEEVGSFDPGSIGP